MTADPHWQQALSRTGEAINQCPSCGVFRLDGAPPTVHKHKCVMGPDGSQIPALMLPERKQHRPEHAIPAGKDPEPPRLPKTLRIPTAEAPRRYVGKKQRK